MAEQRQTLRFRLPWMTAAPAVQTPTPTPTQTTTTPATEPTTTPALRPPFRPPFRPPGLAPAQPPPQAQPSTRTESQPPSPSRAATQFRVTSQPASPTRAGTQSRVTSQPPSPSRTASQTQPAPQPRFLFRLAPQPAGQTSSLPSFPSLTATPAQPTAEAVTQPLSPSEILQPTTQASSQPPPSSTKPPPSVSQQEPKPEITFGNVLIPKPAETKEGKTDGVAYEEPKQRTVTEMLAVAPGSKAPAKEQPSVAFQPEQKQLEILGTKETSATSDSNGKQTKTVISHLKDKNMVSESRQKPALPNGERAPLHKEIREDISKFIHKMATGLSKHPMDEKPVSIITLAGENKGASMQLGSESAKREGAVHIHRGYKINPDESTKGTTDGEGSSTGSSKDPTTKEDQATKEYINSNIQGINNSILFNHSVTERNPGVHLVHNQVK